MKKLPAHVYILIAEIFNLCLKFNYFPTAWKKAVNIVLQKGGKYPTKADRYRSISLINTLSKALEAIFLNRSEKIVKDKKLLCNEQLGFKHQHSADQRILQLTEHVTKKFS